MTSKWQKVNAKDEVHSFVDYLNFSLTHRNSLNKDFIMKNCLVLADLPVTYKVQNYTEKNLSLMESNWPKVKDAVERCVKCVNSFGIDENNLTARNALIPIIYYFHQNPGRTLMTGSADDIRNATTIRRWLLSVLLNNVFGGSSDSILTSIRTEMKEAIPISDFPIERINKKISESGRRDKFDDVTFNNFLATQYPKTFLALSILYDDNNWGDKQINQDHIFPKEMFEYQKMKNAGFETWHGDYYILHNRVGNLELLTQEENLEKLNKPFDEWIISRDPSFKKRHLIPNVPELWKFSNFPSFITEREKLIRNRLSTLFTVPDVQEK